jgi:hypothetical protein
VEKLIQNANAAFLLVLYFLFLVFFGGRDSVGPYLVILPDVLINCSLYLLLSTFRCEAFDAPTVPKGEAPVGMNPQLRMGRLDELVRMGQHQLPEPNMVATANLQMFNNQAALSAAAPVIASPSTTDPTPDPQSFSFQGSQQQIGANTQQALHPQFANLRQAANLMPNQMFQQGLQRPPDMVHQQNNLMNAGFQQMPPFGAPMMPNQNIQASVRAMFPGNPAPAFWQVPASNPPPSASLPGKKPITLYMSCDDDSLSSYQCLVRKQIELFQADREEVEGNAKGRNKPIVLGQVGIRCRHCAMLPHKIRNRGSKYYPAKLNGMYQAAQSMASGHLCYHCKLVPQSLRNELLILREKKSSAGGGKKYWGDGIRVLGVCEDEHGLRFKKR